MKKVTDDQRRIINQVFQEVELEQGIKFKPFDLIQRDTPPYYIRFMDESGETVSISFTTAFFEDGNRDLFKQEIMTAVEAVIKKSS